MTNKAYRDGWEVIFGNNENYDLEEDGATVEISKLVKTKTFQKLPTELNKHAIFSKIKRIKKIFPYIGLKNCLEPCEEIFRDKKTYIGFSSSGATGLWDLATMSMRGVCSCMHWQNSHSKHLIGSITDPFLGIVYITDNEKTPYGISFRKRSLVRFVYNPNLKTYQLIIERPYLDTGNTDPGVYTNRDPHYNDTLEVFRKFLASKVDSKYTVIAHSKRDYTFIPTPTSIKYMTSPEYSMSDCLLSYKEIPNDNFITQFANQD